MSERTPHASHLYTQIVVPLIVASVGLAIIGSAIAVYYLQALTTTWSKQIAESTASSVADRYTQYTLEMRRAAEVAAANPEFAAAVTAGDRQRLDRALKTTASDLAYTNVALLDSSGTVLGTAGRSLPATGSQPFGLPSALATDAGGAAIRVGGSGQALEITAFSPLKAPGAPYTLAVTRAVDDQLLGVLAQGSSSAFCIYSADLRRVACVVPPSIAGVQRASLQTALDSSNGPAAPLLKSANASGGVESSKVGKTDYEMVMHQLTAAGAAPSSGGYLLSVVDNTIAQQAARTSMNIVFVWSTIVVMVLMALGFWVARRVSDPLIELDEGARRIADGDFSTKVTVRGHNEVARLGDSFNEMTDSLRQRSESLTKKVLELATLYEMSRSLGSTLEMDELLGSVLDSALRIFDLDVGYVALRDRETNALEMRAVRGGGVPVVGGGEAVRASMAGWVVREARPLIFNPDPATDDTRIDALTGTRAALCVPLVSSEGTIGAITVGSNDESYRFTSDDVRLLSTIGNHVTIAIGNIELFTRLQDAYLATVRSLAAAVDAKDTYTRGHSDRVATFAVLIAERLDLSHDQRTALEMAAYLHDIGKIGVPESILAKPGALSAEEMSQMRHHPLIGADILRPVAFPWAITPIVRHHHEHWDGSGYPAGLQGEEIPVLARILCVADSFEAMTADRPYRAGRSEDEAAEELERCSGTQFDPAVVAIMLEIIAEQRAAHGDVLATAVDEAGIDDARAIFSALVAGVLASFRRLGGPRLASNVEKDTDAYFRTEAMPFGIAQGRVTFDEGATTDPFEEIACMRRVLRHLDAAIGRVSGSTLVDHFYDEALEGLSGRMRRLAEELDFLSH